MKTNHRQLIVLLCLSACALNVHAQSGAPQTQKKSLEDAKKEKVAHYLGKLPPAEMQVIQRVGRAVLAAQQGATPDPTQEALRNDLIAMGVAMDQALAGLAKTPPQLTGEGRALRALPNQTTQSLPLDSDNLQYRINIGPDGKITHHIARRNATVTQHGD